MLQICSYAGARAEHLLSLAQHLATHALCCGGCSFQTRNRSRHKYRLCTANRQTSPSMMVGSPRNLQGCMHHTHLPVGVFEACGDCCGICVCREMSIRVSKSKTPGRVEISLTIFLYPYRLYSRCYCSLQSRSSTDGNLLGEYGFLVCVDGLASLGTRRSHSSQHRLQGRLQVVVVRSALKVSWRSDHHGGSTLWRCM